MTKTGYLLCGLPGAGKSTAADVLAEEVNGEVFEIGEMIRHMFEDAHGEQPPSGSALGQFAATKRDEEGNGFAMDYLIDNLEAGGLPDNETIVVDSVRHRRGVEKMKEYLDAPRTLWISAPFRVRLNRLQDRGRDDEAGFTQSDLQERDRRELEELGSGTLLGKPVVDNYVMNMAGLDELRENLQDVLHV